MGGRPTGHPPGPDPAAAQAAPDLPAPHHPGLRATLAEQELDELPDGGHEIGIVEWVDYRKTAALPLFPPIGPALAALDHPRAAVTDAALDAVTDENYTWV